MARTKNQRLINLHSSGLSTTNVFEAGLLEYGEIAVRHHKDEARIYTKVSDNEYATFVDEKTVDSKISTIVDPISADVSALSAATKSHIASAEATFATKSEVESAITNASGNLSEVVGTLSGRVDTLESDHETLSGNFDDFKKAAEDDIKALEAWSGAAQAHITSLLGDMDSVLGDDGLIATAEKNAYESAVASAQTYADGLASNLQGQVDKHSNDIASAFTESHHMSGIVMAHLAKYVRSEERRVGK